MNNRRRGARTRRPSDSDFGTPPDDRTPDTADESASDDENARTSDSGKQESTGNENTRNGSDSSAEELSNRDSSRSNADSEDNNEWEKLQQSLATERKRRQDAQRKITEKGNENKSLTETNSTLQNEVSTLKSQVASLLAGENTGRSSDPFGGSDPNGDAGDADLQTEVQMLRNVVSKYMGNVDDVKQRFDTFEEEQTYEADVAALQDRFGVNRDAAQTMIEAFDLGNVVAFAQAFEMASLPREARETLKEERQRRRSAAAVGHPGVPNSTYTPTNDSDDATREAEASRIMNIRSTKSRRQAIEKALDNDPGMFEFLRSEVAEQTGFNL